MTYQEYLLTPYAIAMKEVDYERLKSYADIGVTHLIGSLVPYWVDTTPCVEAIKEATAIQISFLANNDLQLIESGKIVKSEGLDGYSRTYDESITICGMSISLFAQQKLKYAFMSNGLLYKGVST